MSERKRKRRVAVGTLEPLTDIVASDLDIIFVGMNPGEMSSVLGHHYGSKKNIFWECLYKSGLVDRALIYEDDYLMPSEYCYGLTNLVKRPTVSSAELSRLEKREAVPQLKSKLSSLAPKIICFLGKELGELVLGKKVKYGLQITSIEGCASWIFVGPSTSGLATSLKKMEKIAMFHELRECLEFLKEALGSFISSSSQSEEEC